MRILRQLAALLLIAGFGGPASAAEIHKWIDVDGITHYSDQPPPVTIADFDRIVMPSTPTRAAVRDNDYYSIANQWQRMHRERIELERARAERAGTSAVAPRGGETIVVQVPASRNSITILPRHRPGFIGPKSTRTPTRRHRFAIPGRDWPVGLHPGRNDLRASYKSP